MRSYLITGGAGFIGSHICLMLLQNKYSLYILDSFINSFPESLSRVKLISKLDEEYIKNNISIIKGDLRDKNSIKRVFHEAKTKGNNIEGVIHLAGLKSVSQSIINPLIYWENNVISTINLLEVMKDYGCFTIVFSSSASIYDTHSKLIDENTVLRANHPYAETKIAVEKLLNDVYKASKNKWRVANLRYFNPIGAHSSGLIGEDPFGTPNNIFPMIIKVASQEIDKLKIFGNDYPTSDGSGVRDFIHVMDLADGHLKALDYLCLGEPKVINLNIGTGKGTSVLELVKIFERINNVKIPYVFVKRRKGDSAEVVADNSLAKKLIKFSAKRSLSEMCRDGWKWHLKNPHGYRKN